MSAPPKYRSLTDGYDIISPIGSGTCGEVFKGRERATGDLVAIKKIKNLNPGVGFPPNTMRELKLLKQIHHENIIRLRDVIPTNLPDSFVYLIFDYCEYDLEAVLHHKKLSYKEVRCYMRQIVLALEALGHHGWMHRDLKPANLFITPDNVVKLGDFGLARQCQSKDLTSEVITIWYRPPELLMGCQDYGPEVDVWSAGCILYEMMTQRVLFPSMGDSVTEMTKIFETCGYPDEEVWEKWKAYPSSAMFRGIKTGSDANFSSFLDKNLKDDSGLAKDLIQKMLQFDASKRCSVQELLDHPFICSGVDEFLPANMPPMTLEEMHQNMRVSKGRRRSSKKVIPVERVVPKVVE